MNVDLSRYTRVLEHLNGLYLLGRGAGYGLCIGLGLGWRRAWDEVFGLREERRSSKYLMSMDGGEHEGMNA